MPSPAPATEVTPPTLPLPPTTPLPPLANAPPSSLVTGLSLLEQPFANSSSEPLKSRTAYVHDDRPRRLGRRTDEVWLAQTSAFGGSTNKLSVILPGCTTPLACAYSAQSINKRRGRFAEKAARRRRL